MLTSPDLMKYNNKKTILEIIFKKQNIYRAQIAEMTNMSNQTITNLVKELLAENLIKEVTLEKKSKGRNPMALSINGDLLTIGVELSVHGLTACMYSLDGSLVECVKHDLAEDNLLVLKNSLNQLTHHVENRRILGMAISIEGIVDEVTGLVIKSRDIGLDGVNILSELAYLDLPALIRNDVNMLAETDSKKHNEKNYMLIKLDRGIGAALVIDKQVLRSDNNAVGEFGHMTVYGQEEPLKCKCGRTGCLTTLTSQTYIESTLKMPIDQMKENMTAENYTNHLTLYADYISRPLSNLITFMDLNSVILTGAIIKVFGNEFETLLYKSVSEKLSSWHAFKGFKVIEAYDMTERCSRCVIDHYFLNWRK